MKKSIMPLLISVVFITSCVTAQNGAGQYDLSREIKQKIYDSTFEVLIEKPSRDSLKYASELPLESLPYHIRVDKYYSIGTAFAVSETELITAFHVMNLAFKSKNFDKYFIRDKNGNVNEVSMVNSFDSSRDFVKFTVKGRKFSTYLNINENYEINDHVFTVGNAYGEGIIIRRGDLIGTIPEPEQNQFLLLRSSSDVNSGNSGGPLVDRYGNVIGIILSKKDNISYSLPAKELSAVRPSTGVFHRRLRFAFVLMPEKGDFMNYDSTVKLPKPYTEIIDDYSKTWYKNYTSGMDQYYTKYRNVIFPKGDSSLPALYSPTNSFLPQITYKDNDNLKWYISDLEFKDSKVENNASISYASITNFITLLDIQKADDQKVSELIGNSQLISEMILKGIEFTRTVGDQKIRITSLGKAFLNENFADSYGRTWYVSKWDIEYSDQVIVLARTPTPNGVVALLYCINTSVEKEWTYDLKKISDFVQINYYGRLDDWKNFLALKKGIPAVLSKVRLQYKKSNSVNVVTDAIEVSAGNDIVAMDDDTWMSINVYHDPKENKLAVRRVLFFEENKDVYFVIFKVDSPHKLLPDSYHKSWKSAINSEHPYNGISYSEDGRTNIGFMTDYSLKQVKSGKKPDSIYISYLGIEGTVSQDEMKVKLEGLRNSVKITE